MCRNNSAVFTKELETLASDAEDCDYEPDHSSSDEDDTMDDIINTFDACIDAADEMDESISSVKHRRRRDPNGFLQLYLNDISSTMDTRRQEIELGQYWIKAPDPTAVGFFDSGVHADEYALPDVFVWDPTVSHGIKPSCFRCGNYRGVQGNGWDRRSSGNLHT